MLKEKFLWTFLMLIFSRNIQVTNERLYVQMAQRKLRIYVDMFTSGQHLCTYAGTL